LDPEADGNPGTTSHSGNTVQTSSSSYHAAGSPASYTYSVLGNATSLTNEFTSVASAGSAVSNTFTSSVHASASASYDPAGTMPAGSLSSGSATYRSAANGFSLYSSSQPGSNADSYGHTSNYKTLSSVSSSYTLSSPQTATPATGEWSWTAPSFTL